MERFFRFGPTGKPVADATYSTVQETFDLIALRPLSPVHLALNVAADGTLDASWTRRTRLDGDSWQGLEVPLGEAFELYQVRVLDDGNALRSELVSTPDWQYPVADQVADGASGDLILEVAQVSDQFGAGAIATSHFNL